jgi:hypothetical protein
MTSLKSELAQKVTAHMLRIIAIAAALAAATVRLAPAQAQSAEVIAACTPDAIALCHPTLDDARDHRRIVACMKANRKKLSAACRAALARR